MWIRLCGALAVASLIAAAVVNARPRPLGGISAEASAPTGTASTATPRCLGTQGGPRHQGGRPRRSDRQPVTGPTIREYLTQLVDNWRNVSVHMVADSSARRTSRSSNTVTCSVWSSTRTTTPTAPSPTTLIAPSPGTWRGAGGAGRCANGVELGAIHRWGSRSSRTR